MSTGLYVFTMLTYFAGYESVHFGLHYAAKNEPTGAAWGLMHFPVMMHYPVKYGNDPGTDYPLVRWHYNTKPWPPQTGRELWLAPLPAHCSIPELMLCVWAGAYCSCKARGSFSAG